MAESGSVAGLVAKWRQHQFDVSDSPESITYERCIKELEAALAKDELRVAAVGLARQLEAGPTNGTCIDALVRRVLRLAGEA